MAHLTQIRTDLPLTFYPMITRPLTDPQMEALAQQKNDPRFALCDYPLEGNPQIEINDPGQVEILLNWLMANEHWTAVIEQSLQCLAEDDQGRALLTAFVPPDEFVGLAKAVDTIGLVPGLAIAFAEWRSLGATSIYFDGYKSH